MIKHTYTNVHMWNFPFASEAGPEACGPEHYATQRKNIAETVAPQSHLAVCHNQTHQIGAGYRPIIL